MGRIKRRNFKYSRFVKVSASVVLSAALFGSLIGVMNPTTAYASSPLPLASNQASGSGWSIDSSGNLTIQTGQTVDLDSIVPAEWAGQTYSPNTPPTFNNVTVDGTLTTSSSYGDLEFDAQGTVTVASGGTVTMNGMSPGVSGANATGFSGGAGISGNGGAGGLGTSGGTSQAGQLYGGDGSGNSVAKGGGHIAITANDIEVDGTVSSDGQSGTGGTNPESGVSSSLNGSGGGGGGLIELNAPTVNIASGSNVSAEGGGGGGGAGGTDTTVTDQSPYFPYAISEHAGNAKNGQSGSGINGGKGGGGAGGVGSQTIDASNKFALYQSCDSYYYYCDVSLLQYPSGQTSSPWNLGSIRVSYDSGINSQMFFSPDGEVGGVILSIFRSRTCSAPGTCSNWHYTTWLTYFVDTGNGIQQSFVNSASYDDTSYNYYQDSNGYIYVLDPTNGNYYKFVNGSWNQVSSSSVPSTATSYTSGYTGPYTSDTTGAYTYNGSGISPLIDTYIPSSNKLTILSEPSGGSSEALGTNNTTGANPVGTSPVFVSSTSGDGGENGGNGGIKSSNNGASGDSVSNPSTIGAQGGSSGVGGGGGGVGEVKVETTNPSSGITGLSNVTTTPFVVSVPNTLKTISLNQGALYSQSSTVTVSYSGQDMQSGETLELAQDAGFTQNLKRFSIAGTQKSIGSSSSNYYSYSGQVQYTFSGVALNQPAPLYAKLVDSHGSSNTLNAAITPILDTTPPSVSVTVDANQTSTTKLPLQVSTVANDPVSAQGMQMLYSPDGQTWFNVVTSPLSASTVDSNGNQISSALVSATANASSSNPVFVEAQSATDVQPYSSFINGFSITSSPKTVDEQGNTVSNGIWTMDTTLTPNQIKSGEYYVYVLVQDANKNQATGANAIYYQNNADAPNNPNVGSAPSSGSSGSASSTPPQGLVSGSSGTLDASGDTVSISSGSSWSNIGSGSTTDVVGGTSYTMNYTNGVPNTPVGTSGELVDFNGQPTIITNVDTLGVNIPVSSTATQYQLSTQNGETATSWQQVSGGAINTTVTFDHDGLDAISAMIGNGKTQSNWNNFPVLVDTARPTVSVKEARGGGGVSVGSTITLSVSAHEPLGQVPLYYQVSENGGSATSWVLLPTNGLINATIPSSGVNDVTVTVSDLAGNQASDTVSVLGL